MNKYSILLLITLISGGCNEHSVQPEDNLQYKIAFTYVDSLNTILATVNKDGNNLKDVHKLSSSTFYIRWSPDGSKIAFDVYSVYVGVVNNDGLGFKLFPNVDAGYYGEYSWFEDSKRIAFSRNDTIYSFDVINNVEKYIGLGDSPEISPSGDKIAFLKNSMLNIMNSDGTNEFHLADSVQAGFRWSPNEDKIAFVNSNSALYLISSDGNGKVQLTPEGTVVPRINWSPDGSQLTYEHIYGVGVVNDDGTKNKLIAINASFPDWCDDGSVIIYNSVADGLIMVKPDGSDSIHVISIKPEFSVAWSPKLLP